MVRLRVRSHTGRRRVSLLQADLEVHPLTGCHEWSVSESGVALRRRWRRSPRDRHALEREQVAINEQLRLAAEIQRSLLPDVLPVISGFRWAVRMVPAGRIGGDFYDFVELSTGPPSSFHR